MNAQFELALLLLCITWTTRITSQADFSDPREGWGQWGAETECSRTCGGGVQYMTRECLLLGADGGELCSGESREPRSCNTQDCPPESRDYRTEQCEQRHSHQIIKGSKQTWEAGYVDTDPCTLYCRSGNSEVYYKSPVTDGTPCRPDSFDVCVNATCLAVGCDKQLGSKLVFDRCLNCGGNGSECILKSGKIQTDSMKTGYNEVLALPAGSTSILLEELELSENYLAVKDRHGLYHLNGDFIISPDIEKSIGGAYFRYVTLPDGRRRLTTSGPLKYPLHIEVLKQPGTGAEISYEYAVPLNRSETASTISGGSDAYRAEHPNLSSNHAQKEAHSSNTDKTQNPDSAAGQPVDMEWIESNWSECRSCQDRISTRKVFCFSKSSSGLKIHANNKCDLETRPTTQRPCPTFSPTACTEQPQWVASEWSKCSSVCGRGYQYRKAYCVLNQSNVSLVIRPNTDCEEDRRMETERTCEGTCPASWMSGQFGKCSVTCGGGTRSRLVLCISNRRQVDAAECGLDTRPTDSESCNDQPCNVSDETSQGCRGALYGCCPGGVQAALGPDGWGCLPSGDPIPPGLCLETEFGCCSDGLTPASGPRLEGCDNIVSYTEREVNYDSDATPERGYDSLESTTEGTHHDDNNNDDDDPRDLDDDVMEASGTDVPAIVDGTQISINGTPYLVPVTSQMTTAYNGGDDDDDEDDDVDCWLSVYGCCLDGLTRATGPHQDGCFIDRPVLESEIPCRDTLFGCCEDGITIASGLHQEGCSESHTTPTPYTVHIPTPEAQTTATTTTTTRPTTTTRQLVTPTKSSRSCVDSPYGCCLDGSTTAAGENFAGCPGQDSGYVRSCRDSGFGCCSDGITSASGPHELGCPSNPAVDCSLPGESGSCSNYTVRWFFDTALGDCSRFWYGGCDGNGNRFSNQEECKQTCVSPSGTRRCFLPVSTGRCRASMKKFHFNAAEHQCKEFLYGGCHGNDNKFDTIEECEQECGSKLSTDTCNEPYMPGPCRGRHERWFYDTTNAVCRPFSYGGCLGNENRFTSLEACQRRCTQTTTDVCTLDADTGPCRAAFVSWYYSKASRSCEQFVYGGCEGNGNRFETEELCSSTCSASTGQKTKIPAVEGCTQPMDVGPCRAYFERWYYDSADGLCKQFVYGGCEGNENRFVTEVACRKTCNAKQPVDICTLPSDSGNCDDYSVQWFYDQSVGECSRFWFGGCDGNENRFSTVEECQKHCINPPATTTTTTTTTSASTTTSTQATRRREYTESSTNSDRDVCSQPKDSGPCQRPMLRWYYDQTEGRCLRFAYGGCEGNRNRFISEQLCAESCSGHLHRPVVTSPPVTIQRSTGPQPTQSRVLEASSTRTRPAARPTVLVETDTARCRLEREVGPCSADQRRWYYDVTSGTCRHFIFGGCGGNSNNFYSMGECQETCERPMRGENAVIAPPTAAEAVCDLPRNRGSCFAEMLRFYWDGDATECRPFIYGGCNGNGNNFATPADCYSACGGSEAAREGQVRRVYDPLDCFEPVVGGPCFDYEIRYHYKQEASDCLAFYYGGCDGNTNNFHSYDDCIALCSKASASRHCATLECGLRCPYGYIKGDDGCHRCQCYSPCEVHECPSHMECYVEEVQCLTYPCPEPRPSCRLREKLGECPSEGRSYSGVMRRSRRCSRECGVDSDCKGSDKCCPAQSCGMICRQPVFPPAVEKPGHCPTLAKRLVRRVRRCSRECDTDSDCEGSSKCCQAGSCGTICIQPAQSEEEPNYGQYLVPQMSAVEGESTTLPTCQTRSHRNDEVTWFKDNFELERNSTNLGYEISTRGLELYNVSSGHAAMYTCRHGHQLQSYSFTVNVPAKFKTTEDSHQEYLVGQMVTIKCDREGEPEPTITWWRDGRPFRQDYEHILHGDDVIIRRAELKDTSVYECRISNGFGGRPAKRFYIKVVENFTATLTSNSPVNDSFVVGDDAELWCDVEGPAGVESSLEWTHNDQPLTLTGVFKDERYEVDRTKERLTIKDVIRDDAGPFGCEVIRKMEDGTKLTASSNLNVTVEQVAAPEQCEDKPWYANCELIIEARMCRHAYFSIFCCKTCYQAGHLP